MQSTIWKIKLHNKNLHLLIFDDFEQIHFKKDVWKIAEYISKNDWSQRIIVCNKFVNWEIPSYVSEICVTKWWNKWIRIAELMLRYRPKIIYSFHFLFKHIVLWILTKIFSSKSKIYIKWDFNHNNLLYKVTNSLLFRLKIYLKGSLYHLLKIHLSVESEETFQFLKAQIWLLKLIIVRNWADDNDCDLIIKKKKQFLTVWRLWDPSKNSELLLKIYYILAQKLNNWFFYWVGPMTDDFKFVLYNFYKSNPEYSKKIVFTWSISDKFELDRYYEDSQFFILPSRREWAPLVIPEATLWWCIPISWNIPSVSDITNKFEIGIDIDCLWVNRVFTDVEIESLCDKILKFIQTRDLNLISKQVRINTQNQYQRSRITDLLLRSLYANES